jgi:hypothetical protein
VTNYQKIMLVRLAGEFGLDTKPAYQLKNEQDLDCWIKEQEDKIFNQIYKEYKNDRQSSREKA